MPTETMTPAITHTTTKLITSNGTVYTEQGTSSHLISGGRTFIKRSKPRTSFIKPTNYQTEVWSYINMPYTGRVTGNPSQIVSISGNIESFASMMQQASTTMWPSFSSNLYNGVVTDLLLKVKDQRVNLAQAFLERKRTADLLADSLTRIAKSVRALRRGNWRDAGKFLKQNWKEAPATWLEYQYGWKPLLNDVYGSMEALKQRTDPVDWLLTVKAGRKQEDRVVKTYDTATWQVQQSAIIRGETFRGIFARVDYRPSDYFLQRLQANSGIENPLLLAWEFIPFSFVIDWGAQVGSWLSSMDATSHMEFYGGSYTDRRELITVLEPDSTKTYGGSGKTTWIPTKNNSTGRRFVLARNAWESWPLAKAPRFKDPLSLLHVANALSLLAVALKPGPVRVR